MGSKNKNRKPADDGFSAPVKAKTAEKKKSASIPVICMVLVMALCVGVIVYTKVADSGFFYRTTVTVSSENYEVNNAMMSYFFNSQYQNMAETLEQMGVDLTKNLKDQAYTTDMSWFDYLMQNVTIPQVEQILVLCEAAKAAGFELDEHEKEHVDEAVESIEAMAKSYSSMYGGAENYYIRNIYGYGINIKDIRKAIELNQLAAAYSESLVDSYNFEQADWDAYLEEHKDDFLVVDYVTYTFEAEEEEKEEETSATTEATTEVTTEAETTGVAGSASDETTAATTAEEEEELSEEKKVARALANQLAQQMMAQPDKALDIFNTEVKKHLEEVVYADEEDAEKKAESVQTDMDATVVEAVMNDETSEFMKFVFDDEREDNTFVTDDDKNGRYTVYLITKEPYIEEYTTRNVRIIALSASSGDDIEEERDAIIEEFEAGDKSEDAFAELAKTHSDDSTAHENGGLYENQGKVDLGVDELNEWLYGDRKAGDYTYASNGETGTSEVIYIAYYIGEGMVKWCRDVDSALVAEAYDEKVTELKETHTVTTDLNNAYKIPSQAGL